MILRLQWRKYPRFDGGERESRKCPPTDGSKITKTTTWAPVGAPDRKLDLRRDMRRTNGNWRRFRASCVQGNSKTPAWGAVARIASRRHPPPRPRRCPPDGALDKDLTTRRDLRRSNGDWGRFEASYIQGNSRPPGMSRRTRFELRPGASFWPHRCLPLAHRTRQIHLISRREIRQLDGFWG